MVKLLLVFFFVIFLSPIFFFLKYLKKKMGEQKKSFWKGILVDKKHFEYEDDHSAYTKDAYVLHFKTYDGMKVKFDVSRKIYDDWQLSDRAEKTAGEMLPKKT